MHCKLAILGTLEMLDLTHQKILVSICSSFQVYLHVKNQLNKLVILGILSMPGHTPKIMHQFEKTFNFYRKAKKQLHPSCFPGDIAKTL